MITIQQVSTPQAVKSFIDFPLHLYKNCPYFVPPLYADEKKLVASGGNTTNADSIFLLAYDENHKVVGRIQGIIEKQYNQIHHTAKARFTRFDSINDLAVAKALFSAVEKWGKARGMKEICGPLGYTDLDREGLLVEGFEENSTFEEQYNYPYYQTLLENCGFVKDADWLEFELTRPEIRNEMLHRVAVRSLELNKLHVAKTDLPKAKYIEKYRDGFFYCLHECYKHLYGTVPISKQGQDELLDQFMMIVNKEYLILICDEAENVVGFGLCFPGIGDALKKSGGKLTPFTLLKILHKVNNPEVIDLGLVAILPKYQNAGINAVILDALLTMLEEGKIKKCETNLNLETNIAVLAQWKYFHSRQHKRRRSYIKRLEESKMLDQLKEILRKVLPQVDMAEVTEETRLMDDLGFDSLAMMMLSMEIEDAFGFKFQEFVRFETVGDVCGYLENRI